MYPEVLGIDEAGRGPLAGPVALGLVVAPRDFDVAQEFPGIKDSKLLTEKRREDYFAAPCGEGRPTFLRAVFCGIGYR
jgi:ribonuclease HII